MLRERLLARRPDRDAGVRARRLEELRDACRRWARGCAREWSRPRIAERVAPPGCVSSSSSLGVVALAERVHGVFCVAAEGEERVVGEREERTAQRRRRR